MSDESKTLSLIAHYLLLITYYSSLITHHFVIPSCQSMKA